MDEHAELQANAGTDDGSCQELAYLLSGAAELKHSLACLYCFAVLSLKSGSEERGLTTEEANIVREWKGKLSVLAIDEMQHMAQVANLLACFISKMN